MKTVVFGCVAAGFFKETSPIRWDQVGVGREALTARERPSCRCFKRNRVGDACVSLRIQHRGGSAGTGNTQGLWGRVACPSEFTIAGVSAGTGNTQGRSWGMLGEKKVMKSRRVVLLDTFKSRFQRLFCSNRLGVFFHVLGRGVGVHAPAFSE